MLVALDEGPGPAIKYQYAELTRLYQVVSQLIRSCDVSHKCQSSQPVSFIFCIFLTFMKWRPLSLSKLTPY